MVFHNMDNDTILVATDAAKGKVLSGGIVARPVGKKATILSLVFKVELGGLIPTRIMHESVVTIFKQFAADLWRFCDNISEIDSEIPSRNGELDEDFIQ